MTIDRHFGFDVEFSAECAVRYALLRAIDKGDETVTVKVDDLRAALGQPAQEPVYHIYKAPDGHIEYGAKPLTSDDKRNGWTETPLYAAPQPAQKTFQEEVADWMAACFTPDIIADKLERADRFIEEALELVQATGYSADRAHALVDYVFNRPVGEPSQEVGGVMVTLAALCNPHGLDMDAAGSTELARVWTKIDKIREKQASKPVGSALPIPPLPSQQPATLPDESR